MTHPRPWASLTDLKLRPALASSARACQGSSESANHLPLRTPSQAVDLPLPPFSSGSQASDCGANGSSRLHAWQRRPIVQRYCRQPGLAAEGPSALVWVPPLPARRQSFAQSCRFHGQAPPPGGSAATGLPSGADVGCHASYGSSIHLAHLRTPDLVELTSRQREHRNPSRQLISGRSTGGRTDSPAPETCALHSPVESCRVHPVQRAHSTRDPFFGAPLLRGDFVRFQTIFELKGVSFLYGITTLPTVNRSSPTGDAHGLAPLLDARQAERVKSRQLKGGATPCVPQNGQPDDSEEQPYPLGGRSAERPFWAHL